MPMASSTVTVLATGAVTTAAGAITAPARATTAVPTVGLIADPTVDLIAARGTTGTAKTSRIGPSGVRPRLINAGRATYLFAAKKLSSRAAHSSASTPPRTCGR
ncbi:hypothetical protein DE4585_00202 [Mycobacteroides salmoniphilum]|uniref:Uncharacterized protein n=1 Tax=Mycobacteroides salmoniphilum TaxID=404941 RepID=A0A4R8S9U7_9MYCO|nr:hypothetical protein DE4585_00202 [Mycobacteroides salmoniphilum]